MRFLDFVALTLGGALTTACHSTPATPAAEATGTYAELVGDLERREGLFTLHLDADAARVWFELPAGEFECLYVEGLRRGLGSNDVGLDRGQLGPTRVVRFRRVGDRVLLEAPNLDFRSGSGDPDAERAALDSFATSILWAGRVGAEVPGGGYLFEATSLLVRDAHGTEASLEASGGQWSLDAERSVFLADEALVFPDNLELEALLTFSGSKASREIREVTPSSDSVSLVQHHSFVRLPDAGYRLREWHAGLGALSRSHIDLDAAVGEANRKQLAVRHRLELDIEAEPRANGERRVLEPIVYYVDRGAPEPVRSALVEGASWWSEAFRAAGVENGFRVELLPEGVHPLDVRYNVIQWVHRSSRGWSYGGGVVDPRTGEMIKGHVTLGSLRVRQDRMIFEGLFGADATGQGGPNDPLELALARVRQLAAHEVGHTLGLAHNFSASTEDRASVMDYPAPLIELDGAGELSGARAYGSGLGSWDVGAIMRLYPDLRRRIVERGSPRRDRVRLIGSDGEATGDGWEITPEERPGVWRFATDADARPPGAAHPLACLWDNGSDPIAELQRVMQVRRVALEGFGVDRVPMGSSLAALEEVFLPLYFWHRYQVEAAAKSIGGVVYGALSRDDWLDAIRPERVDAVTQLQALEALMGTLAPEVLDVPEFLAAGLPPRTQVSGRRREAFAGRTAPMLDTLGLAEASARLTLRSLLQHERLGRVVDQATRDPEQLDVATIFATLTEVFAEPGPGESDRALALREVIHEVVVDETLRLARNGAAAPRVRAEAEVALQGYAKDLADQPAGNASDLALVRRIRRFLDRETDELAPTGKPRDLPPGSPIGVEEEPLPLGPGWGGCSNPSE